MMSHEIRLFGDDAEKIVLGTPELVEKLLSYLDLPSIKHLAEFHKVTRGILGNTFAWSKVIKRTFPEDEITNTWTRFISGDDTMMASERQKARLLGKILGLMKRSERAELEMDLIHIICERFPILNPRTGSILVMTPIVDLTCSCLQIHRVSSWGFLLLEDVVATLGLRKNTVLNVDRVKGALEGPTLEALSSFLTRQQGLMVNKLEVKDMECKTKEASGAIATIVNQSDAVLAHPRILVTEEIGRAGWEAIRRAVENLSKTFGREVDLYSERKPMIGGRREDLKAIWEKVSCWEVASGGSGCEMTFDRKSESLEENELNWMMLDTVIDMPEEEWMEEVDNRFDSDKGEETESDDEKGEDSNYNLHQFPLMHHFTS